MVLVFSEGVRTDGRQPVFQSFCLHVTNAPRPTGHMLYHNIPKHFPDSFWGTFKAECTHRECVYPNLTSPIPPVQDTCSLEKQLVYGKFSFLSLFLYLDYKFYKSVCVCVCVCFSKCKCTEKRAVVLKVTQPMMPSAPVWTIVHQLQRTKDSNGHILGSNTSLTSDSLHCSQSKMCSFFFTFIKLCKLYKWETSRRTFWRYEGCVFRIKHIFLIYIFNC